MLATDAYMAFIAEDYRLHSAMGKIEVMRLVKQVGRKFIKIVEVGRQTRVHSFIVIKDFVTGEKAGSKPFKAGDILMAASFNQPALNKARGNVLELDYQKSTWTGAGYL